MILGRHAVWISPTCKGTKFERASPKIGEVAAGVIDVAVNAALPASDYSRSRSAFLPTLAVSRTRFAKTEGGRCHEGKEEGLHDEATSVCVPLATLGPKLRA